MQPPIRTLQGDVEQHLAKGISSTMRRYVRRNDKHGVTMETSPSDAQIEDYIAIYERSYRDNAWEGEKFSRQFFYGVARDLGRGGQLALVLHDGRVIGGGVLFIDPSVVHYFQGAIDRDVKDAHPHVALYTYALRHAAEHGIGHVNVGGVNDGNEGLMRFKMSWGAEPTPSPMLSYVSGPRQTLRALRRRLPSRPSLF